MKQSHEAIYVVTATPGRGEEIRQAIALRDFDEILCVPYDNAALLLKANPPALAVIDTESDSNKLSALMSQIPATVPSVVMHTAWDEDLFLTCHDHGARDFLIKPVPDVYLVSRVLRGLQERRLHNLLSQKDQILAEMGVLSPRSDTFTTHYLLKLLKREVEELSPHEQQPLSLLIIQLDGYQSPLPDAAQTALYQHVARTLKECCRGFDLVGEYFMDKFAVIMPNTGMNGARALAGRLNQRLNGYEFRSPATQFRLQVRTGYAEFAGCRHYEDLLNKALEALKSTPLKVV